MNTIAIIQARMGSSRFPGKVMSELVNKPMIKWVYDGVKDISSLSKVVVATTDTEVDDVIEKWCINNQVLCFRGSEQDVLKRFYEVATYYKSDAVMRITADCPLIDSSVCHTVLTKFRLSNFDYVCNFEPRSWPDGLDVEVMTYSSLKLAHENAVKPYDREHVTTYIRSNRFKFNVGFVRCPIPGLHTVRWTVDVKEDLEHLQNLLLTYPANYRPSWTELLNEEKNEEKANYKKTLNVNVEKKSEGTYANSNALLDKAIKSIPLASQTVSKSYVQYPYKQSPLYLTHGVDSKVWDVDGNEYIDLVSGLLPIILGYCDQDVDEAILEQLSRGISYSLSTDLELKLTDELIELIPSAEMVRFGKNGSDVTTAAIRLARAHTGNERIAVCGYHGWHDWYIGSTSRNYGVTESTISLVHRFEYNNITNLNNVLNSHPDEFAAIIMEPVNSIIPDSYYLSQVKELAHKHNALLIFDEIITGFRIGIGGAQEYFNVTPDLSCFGKAMGNGMPISALVGRADVMHKLDEVFFSGTFGGETLSIVSALAVIKKMKESSVIEKIWETGEVLSKNVESIISNNDASSFLSIKGLAPWKILQFSECSGISAMAIKTLFIREMIKQGILISSSHNITFSHNNSDVEKIKDAYSRVLPYISDMLVNGDVNAELNNNVINPVFSVR